MAFIYTIENRNPVIGPKVGEKQSVSVYDRKLGNRRSIVTTPEAVDDFVSDRDKAMKQANSLLDKIVLGTVLVGAAVGAAISAKKAVNLGKLVEEKLNPRYLEKYQEALNEHVKKFGDNHGFSGFMSKIDVLNEDAFKKHSFKLSGLFSEEKNIFLKPSIKKAGLEGAGIGSMVGFLCGLPACIIPENADEKITNEFIENNK